MGTIKLEFDYDYDFLLFGISCHIKDYRLCWNINKSLNINLIKQNDLKFQLPKLKTDSFFSNYLYENESMHTKYVLISNRCENGTLILEEKQSDFFLLVEGIYESEEKKELLKKLNKISIILTAFEINVESLKSKELLIF